LARVKFFCSACWIISDDRVQKCPVIVGCEFEFVHFFVRDVLSVFRSVPFVQTSPSSQRRSRDDEQTPGGIAVTIATSSRGHQDVLNADVFSWSELPELLAAEDLFDAATGAGLDRLAVMAAKDEDEDDDDDDESLKMRMRTTRMRTRTTRNSKTRTMSGKRSKTRMTKKKTTRTMPTTPTTPTRMRRKKRTTRKRTTKTGKTTTRNGKTTTKKRMKTRKTTTDRSSSSHPERQPGYARHFPVPNSLVRVPIRHASSHGCTASVTSVTSTSITILVTLPLRSTSSATRFPAAASRVTISA
jgi:hypothetical protein